MKFFQFSYPTGSFGDTSQSVEFLGQTFLDGTAPFEVTVVGVTGVFISIDVRLHCHDGSGATQLVVVSDGDDRLFGDIMNGCIGRFVSLSTTSRSRGVNESRLHRERFVRSELFIGIEFRRESLEVRIQTVTPLSEFAYGESGGLKSVREGVGLHGEMDG